ncbi:MAG: hypothetical protein V4504_01515 [Patescibacteria group bacterium]
MKNRILISICMFVFVIFAQHALAQVSDTDIVLNVSPQNTVINDTVNATVSSYSTDLNKSYITWSLNGEELLTGIGKKNFSFTMKNSNVTLQAKINTIDGQNLVKSTTINTSQVDMLWEAVDSYVPPFYKGKAYVSKEGYFKVIAMPNTGASPINISYTWTKDGNGQPSTSGWGKNSLIVKNTYLDKTNKIEVNASDILGNQIGKGSIALTPINPKILFYEDDPQTGFHFEKALGSDFTLNKNEDMFFVAPYFFNGSDLEKSDLIFTWVVNGETIANPNPVNILSVKPEEGKSGSAKIKVGVKKAKTFFQNAEKELNVQF